MPPLVEAPVATEGDIAEPSVGAASSGQVAAVLGDAVATGGAGAGSAVGAGSFAEAKDASAAADPFSAATMAQAGVGAGSASDSADVSAGDENAGSLAVVSAKAIEIGDSEAKAAAPSAIAEIRRTFWAMTTSLCVVRRCAPLENPVASPTCRLSDRFLPPEMAAASPASATPANGSGRRDRAGRRRAVIQGDLSGCARRRQIRQCGRQIRPRGRRRQSGRRRIRRHGRR
jgi:hypothetical protein